MLKKCNFEDCKVTTVRCLDELIGGQEQAHKNHLKGMMEALKEDEGKHKRFRISGGGKKGKHYVYKYVVRDNNQEDFLSKPPSKDEYLTSVKKVNEKLGELLGEGEYHLQ